MTDRKISNFEFATLNYFLTRAFLIVITFNTIVNVLKQDSYIIPIISIIPALIIIVLINYIINYKPNLNLADKILTLFGKRIGKIILLMLFIFIYCISVFNFLNLNNFIQSQFLNKTPIIVISIAFMLTTFYIVKKGINVISRTSNILFYIGIFLLIITFIGLFPAFKITNLKPFFTSSITDYSKALNSFYSFNILPIILLTIIPKNNLKSPKIKKTLIVSYIVSAISLFIIIFQTIATFGYELTEIYEYPEFFVLKHVVLVHLSSRVESILVIQLILDIFIYNVFSIYFMGNTVKSIFNSKKLNTIYFILCILVVGGTIYISKYNMFIDGLIMKFAPAVLSLFITVLILIIIIKIKTSKN